MKHFFNKPYLLPTLISLALLWVGTLWLSPVGVSVPQLTGDARWLVLAFAFLFCLFCWVGLSLFEFGEVAWARVDYAWLLLAGLALLVQGGSAQHHYLSVVLLLLAVALRAARVKGDIVVKSRQRSTVWLVVNGQVEIPLESLLEMKLQRVKARLQQLLHDWRTAGLSMVHVRLDSGEPQAALSTAVLPIHPTFRDNEFRLDLHMALASSTLGRWLSNQQMETLYLFGVIDPRLVSRLQHWGRENEVEVIVDIGYSLMLEERVPHPVTERVMS